MALTYCDSCTEMRECVTYDIDGHDFYWCDDCRDDEGGL